MRSRALCMLVHDSCEHIMFARDALRRCPPHNTRVSQRFRVSVGFTARDDGRLRRPGQGTRGEENDDNNNNDNK